MTPTWTPAAASPPLERGVAHVWRVRLPLGDAALAELTALLAPSERERMLRFRLEEGRHTATVSYGLRRRVLAAILDADPHALAFDLGEHDKPALVNDPALHFNVSHSAGMLLLAVAWDAPLGIDVERIKPRMDHERIARRFFSPHEVDVFLALPEDERMPGFFRCWTRKEAFIKARGAGFTFPLRDFDVSLEPGVPQLLAVRSAGDDAANWRMHDLDVGEGFEAALVTAAHVRVVQRYDDRRESDGGV